jgi:hypothetical protein
VLGATTIQREFKLIAILPDLTGGLFFLGGGLMRRVFIAAAILLILIGITVCIINVMQGGGFEEGWLPVDIERNNSWLWITELR